MQIIDTPQGSLSWLAVRARHFTASEAAAMLGTSQYTTRNELLKQKATGIVQEADAFKRALFDKGHEAEAGARLIVEAEINEDLYPVTGTLDVEGLPLLASFDGLTLDEDTTWEHKLFNAQLAEYILTNQDVPETHYPQLEQGLLVSGASVCIFTVSDGTAERMASIRYRSKPERREALIAGWKQFAEDLKNYRYVEEKPEVVAAPIEDLPALTVEITGRVLSSNLAQWKGVVVSRIQAINTDLRSDEDFAIAEKTVKFLDDAEKRVDLVKEQAQSQSADLDTLYRTLDGLKAEMRSKRLTLEKLVKAQKDSIRVEIAQEGRDALAAHIAALNQRIGRAVLIEASADFAGAMKGKKTITSLREAVGNELARAKIDASALADKVEANLQTMAKYSQYQFLFHDSRQLLMKSNEDLLAVIENRIAKHKAEEAARIEAETARIRAEEERKAKAEAQKLIDEATRQAQIDAERAKQKADAELVAQPAPQAVTVAPVQQPVPQQPIIVRHGTSQRETLRKSIDTALDTMDESGLKLVQHYINRMNQREAA